MKYVKEDIYKIIPNRYPLMFIDSIEIDGDDAIGVVELNEDTWFFECHYPDNPIMPFSLMLECMTQTFSSIFLSRFDSCEIPVISSISGLEGKGIKLKEKMGPGDTLILKASLISFRRGIAKGTCRAYKNSDEAAIMEIEIVEVLPSQMVKI